MEFPASFESAEKATCPYPIIVSLAHNVNTTSSLARPRLSDALAFKPGRRIAGFKRQLRSTSWRPVVLPVKDIKRYPLSSLNPQTHSSLFPSPNTIPSLALIFFISMTFHLKPSQTGVGDSVLALWRRCWIKVK